ncbi:zinc-ribbon domain-containing protein [Dictyobacter kobayashii]|uniref:zinc-ribbon domain-containing protein n=1 Tax=Dictyobacter kobayashii TaxID=2014872 RepID=UPI000F84A602|nr:zinc-ribbon domain-containing protein [Dictyobacter kobayashii]
MKRCKNCQYENAPESMYCERCGASLDNDYTTIEYTTPAQSMYRTVKSETLVPPPPPPPDILAAYPPPQQGNNYGYPMSNNAPMPMTLPLQFLSLLRPQMNAVPLVPLSAAFSIYGVFSGRPLAYLVPSPQL